MIPTVIRVIANAVNDMKAFEMKSVNLCLSSYVSGIGELVALM